MGKLSIKGMADLSASLDEHGKAEQDSAAVASAKHALLRSKVCNLFAVVVVMAGLL